LFSKVIERLLAAVLLIALVSISTFVFHTLPLYGAEAQPTHDYARVVLDDLMLEQTAVQTGEHPGSDSSCRSCHSDTDAVVELPSGETFGVQVDMDALAASAHGARAEDPLLCTSCHAAASFQFPHDDLEATDLREFQIAQSATCERCHQQPHLTGHPGPESQNPVVCTDCHSSHDVLTVEQMNAGEGTAACVDCHTQSGVELTDPDALTSRINAGLFAQQEINNDYCLSCHSQEGVELQFPNGDAVSVTVDAAVLHDSVHGADNSWEELACTDCHSNYRYPHDPITVESAREYTLQQNMTCERCHEQKFDATLDSVHGEALMEGNLEAAACTDCHGAHNTQVPNEPRQRISQTCEQCHSQIYDEYIESVHGEALVTGDPDVPTCIDCHGVHNIGSAPPAMLMKR
jgi:predicted CXXCH cytochrome family protein